jgi:fatty-acyl-CoA synthase
MAVSVPASLPTVTGLLLDRAGSPEPGLRFEDRRWSWQEHISECARYAAALRARRTPGRPFHVGVLADNVPEFSFLLGGCAFALARCSVALNPVRRGEAPGQGRDRDGLPVRAGRTATRRCCPR